MRNSALWVRLAQVFALLNERQGSSTLTNRRMGKDWVNLGHGWETRPGTLARVMDSRRQARWDLGSFHNQEPCLELLSERLRVPSYVSSHLCRVRPLPPFAVPQRLVSHGRAPMPAVASSQDGAFCAALSLQSVSQSHPSDSCLE